MGSHSAQGAPPRHNPQPLSRGGRTRLPPAAPPPPVASRAPKARAPKPSAPKPRAATSRSHKASCIQKGGSSPSVASPKRKRPRQCDPPSTLGKVAISKQPQTGAETRCMPGRTGRTQTWEGNVNRNPLDGGTTAEAVAQTRSVRTV